MFGAISTTAFYFALSGLITGVTSILLAAFVILKNPSNGINRSWALFCVAVSIWGFGGMMIGLAQTPEEALFWGKISQTGGSPLIAPAFYHFVLSFVGITRKKIISLRFAYGAALFFILANHLTPFYFTKGILVLSSFYWIKGGPLLIIMVVWWVSIVMYAHILLYQSHQISDTNRKNQIRLIFCGVAIGYLGGFTEFLIAFGIPMRPYGNWLIPFAYITTTYAIIKYKAMEIETVIHKTTMWLVFSSLIAIPAAFLFFLSYPWLSQITPFQFSLLAVGLVLLLIPYIQFVQPRIDHLFQRRKYDMQQILQGIVQELGALKDLDSLITKVTNTIQEALYVSRIIVVLWENKHQAFRIVVGKMTESEEAGTLNYSSLSWIKEHDRVIELEEISFNPMYESIRPIAQAYFKQFDSKIALPLIHNNRLIGLINLGAKNNLKPFSKTDLGFLTNLRAEASIALSNSLLYDDVSKMSEELRQWANELERKVEERTHELAENKRDLEQSYQKLQELDAIKSQFFANISHEFRTPLTLMLAPIDTLRQQKITDSPQVHRQLDIAYNNGLRLLKLINNLLELAKIDSGKVALRYQTVNIGSFLREIVRELSSLAEHRGITLLLSVQDLSFLVSFDPDKIEKVVLNLLFNAVKFTPAGGKISITCQKEGECLCISVADNGPGIRPEMRDKIFDRFFQVDGASTRSHEGTGIGLAVVKELVELHGGTITVASAPNQGSIFSFRLPLRETMDPIETNTEWVIPDGFQSFSKEAEYHASDLIAAEDPSSVSSLLSGSRPKVLIVEDNADMRRFLSEKLREYYEIVIAADGEEGLQLAKKNLPDLIVSDVMMPKKDGFQLCRDLKNDPATASLPVMLLTAKADLASKMEGFGCRADDYLVKPFNTEELLARVRSQIERRSSVKNLEEFLKTAQHQVQEANLLMMEMAHEIKNPVSFAKGNVSLLNRSVQQAEQSGEWQRTFEEMRDSIQIIGAGLDRVSAIVGNVKQFLSPNLESRTRFSLTEIMNATLNLLSVQFEGQVIVHRDFKTDGMIEGVADQIQQLFLNLIKNAIEAMNGKGELKVLIAKEENRIIVTIQDNGPGVPPEILPKLFDPFFTTKKGKGGTGLGLSICKKIVERHHGEIGIKNMEGGGTEVKVLFPLPHEKYLPS